MKKSEKPFKMKYVEETEEEEGEILEEGDINVDEVEEVEVVREEERVVIENRKVKKEEFTEATESSVADSFYRTLENVNNGVKLVAEHVERINLNMDSSISKLDEQLTGN